MQLLLSLLNYTREIGLFFYFCGRDDLKEFRRDARVVEWDGPENRCTGNGTVGSNPTLSAIKAKPKNA